MRIFLVGIFSVAALAQTASFEAATIKPAGPEEIGISGGDGRNGILKLWNMTLRQCIGSAYRVPESLVVGGPSWIGTDRYEINATFEGPVAIAPNSPPVRLMAMERALLADRFKLKVHQETRQLPVFDLVRSRADGRLGPRLVPSDGKCLPLPSTAAPINTTGITTAALNKRRRKRRQKLGRC